MRTKSVSFGNYNPKMLYNNPPYITNYPFWEYMTENKADFDMREKRLFHSIVAADKNEESFMSGLLTFTLAASAAALIIARNKVKNGYNIAKLWVKNNLSKVRKS